MVFPGTSRVVTLLLALTAGGQASALQTAATVIRERIEELNATGRVAVHGVTIGTHDLLPAFYRRRDFSPVWTDTRRVDGLLDAFTAAIADGLDPEDYFLSRLRALRARTRGTDADGDFDLLLTEALIRFAYHQRFGKVNPETLEPHWNFSREFVSGADPVALLETIVAADQPVAELARNIPRGPWYRRLQRALAQHRDIAAAGGWPLVPVGPTLHRGDRDARVAMLRERLASGGDLQAAQPPAEPDLVDEAVTEALRRFQRRHALKVDGVLGKATLAALNVPIARRIDQLRMSLERARWISVSVPADFVAINIASFEAGLIHGGDVIWSSRVVVGRDARQTPIFRGTMTYLEINPTWTIPPTILRKDILPRIRKDPGYLSREHIRVFDRRGTEVDAATVDWAAFTKGVPYTLRQDPGPWNALGRIKFMFPNEHFVYLHDTPAKELFEKVDRTFSSGCIRVEDPLTLAVLLLDDPAWTREALEAAIATGRTRRVGLRKPVPVLILYWTAIADADGTVRFFRDVYGRDARLLPALNGEVRVERPRRG